MDITQLRKSIGAVLQRYKIDNLALEMEITSAVQLFLNQTERGRDAEKIRSDIETAFLTGQEAHRGKEQIADYIKDKLHINPTGPALEARWGRLYEYAYIRETQHKEKVELFVRWWLNNKPDAQFWSPEQMMTLWPQAFKNKPEQPCAEREDAKHWMEHI